MADMFPITGLGLALCGLCWFSWYFWVDGRLDFVVRAVVVTTIIVLAICMLVTLIGTAFVYRSVRHPKKMVSEDWRTGELRKTGFSVPRLNHWPFAQVDVSWGQPAAAQVELRRDESQWTEFVRMLERGRFSQIRGER